MDLDILAHALEEAVANSDRMRMKCAGYPSDVRDAMLHDELSRPLQKLFHDWSKTSGKALLRTGNGAIGTSYFLPLNLVRRAVLEGVKPSIEWLSSLLAKTEADYVRIMPIWGVDLDQKIGLTDTCSVRPLASLPSSIQKDEITKRRLPQFGNASYTWTPPTSAIVVSRKLSPLFHSEDQSFQYDKTVDEEVEDARLCLSLVGPRLIIPGPQWDQFIDPDLANLSLGGMSFRYQEIQAVRLKTFGDFDEEQARQVAVNFFGIPEVDRDRIRLALERFDRAMRRFSSGDAALELAMALEALLGDGNTELTWRVSFRSALLIGGTKAEMIEVRALVQAIYSLRSSMVHTGKVSNEVKTKIGKLSAAAVSEKGIAIAADVITAAINRGNLPNWFEAEFGF